MSPSNCSHLSKTVDSTKTAEKSQTDCKIGKNITPKCILFQNSQVVIQTEDTKGEENEMYVYSTNW